MPIPYKLDYVIEKLAEAGTSERQAIKAFAGINLPAGEALEIWPRILDHKWYISERLGRDTGLRVAAIDYFENIHETARTVPRTERSRMGLRLTAARNLAA
jgi:hypothetical protein